MRNILFYLSSAKDFLEGSDGVNRVKAFCNSNPELAEELWQNMFSAEDKPKEFDDFVRLIDVHGLYIQNETRVPKLERDKHHDPQFEIRVYPLGNIRVAVLKTSYLPYSAF